MASVEFPSTPTGSQAPAAPAATPPLVSEIPTTVAPAEVPAVPAATPAVPAKASKGKAKATPAEPVAAPAAPPETPVAIPEPPAEPPPEYVIAQVTKADMAKYTEEVTSNGDLSAESLAELESKGIPSDMAKAHVMTMKAHQTQVRNDVLSVVGGEEAFKVVSTWAASKLDQSQRDAFNEAARSGNVGVLKTMLTGIKAQYEAEMGSIGGTTLRGTASTGLAPFASRQEMVNAFNSVKYKTDGAYRDQCAKRIPAEGFKF